MQINKIISWSKWVDPLGRNKGEFEYVPEKEVVNREKESGEDYHLEEVDVDEIPATFGLTPLGLMPLRPFNDPTKIFNFWLGETNFPISKKVVNILNNTEGVEILDVFTKYKFRIAIGNNFKFQEVRQTIEQALDASKNKNKYPDESTVLSEDLQNSVKSIVDNNLKHFKNWAIYVLPNGKIDFIYSNEVDDKFNSKLNIYIKSKEVAGGAILTSNNYNDKYNGGYNGN